MIYFYNNNWYEKRGNNFYPITVTSSCFGTISKYPVEDYMATIIDAFGEEKEPAWRDR